MSFSFQNIINSLHTSLSHINALRRTFNCQKLPKASLDMTMFRSFCSQTVVCCSSHSTVWVRKQRTNTEILSSEWLPTSTEAHGRLMQLLRWNISFHSGLGREALATMMCILIALDTKDKPPLQTPLLLVCTTKAVSTQKVISSLHLKRHFGFLCSFQW